jgi:hypothetical protein
VIVALYALSVIATVAAWILARRRAEHLPIAALLTVGLGTDLARRALRSLYLGEAIRRLGNDAPWTGWPRVAAVASHALFLAWPATIVAVALVVYLRRRPWPALLGYAASIVAIVVVHPIAGNGSLGRMLTAGMMIGLLVGVGCAATWYLKPAGDPASKAPTSTAQATLTIMLAGELASLVGSWRLGIFDHWHLSQIAYLFMFSILNILQWGFVWQSRSS